jgi:hypothetical protein
MDEDFRKAALEYHRLPRPGKLAIEATKRMATQTPPMTTPPAATWWA